MQLLNYAMSIDYVDKYNENIKLFQLFFSIAFD